MFCKNCGKPIDPNAAVCLSCGVTVGKGNKYCANCGAQPDPLASVCVKCGHPIRHQYDKEKSGGVDDFGGAIKACFSKYATFNGRANRSEFWFWYLFCFIFACIPFVNFIAALAFLIPNLAVAVRRLHDIGKSGWNYLFCLIPLVGAIMLIIWWCQPSQEGDNEYGPNPNI